MGPFSARKDLFKKQSGPYEVNIIQSYDFVLKHLISQFIGLEKVAPQVARRKLAPKVAVSN